MPRKSTIDRLPAEIRELIGTLRRDGRTIDEILTKLGELNVEVARSTAGRYIQGLDKVLADMHHSRAIAEAVTAAHDGAPPSRQGLANIEMMQTIVMKMLRASEDGGLASFDPKEAMMAAAALEKLGAARKRDLDYTREIRAEMAKQAATAATQVARKAGISEATIRAIETEVLGIVRT